MGGLVGLDEERAFRLPWRAGVPTALVCWRSDCPGVLVFRLPWRAGVPTALACWRAGVPTALLPWCSDCPGVLGSCGGECACVLVRWYAGVLVRCAGWASG